MKNHIENYREITFNIGRKKIVIAGMAHPYYYNDSLSETLDQLQKNNVQEICSLEKSGHEKINQASKAFGISTFCIDITDFTAPSPSQLDWFLNHLIELPNNSKIAIHCMGGNGRTGTMIAAAVLLETLMANQDNPQAVPPSPIRDHSIQVPGQNVKCTKLVYDAVNRLRGIQNGEHSVEASVQVDALNELQGKLFPLNDEKKNKAGTVTSDTVYTLISALGTLITRYTADDELTIQKRSAIEKFINKYRSKNSYSVSLVRDLGALQITLGQTRQHSSTLSLFRHKEKNLTLDAIMTENGVDKDTRNSVLQLIKFANKTIR